MIIRAELHITQLTMTLQCMLMGTPPLTTNAITCGPISCTGTGTKQLSPTVAGVYLGLDTSAVGGMEICCSSSPYIDFTTISNDFKRNDYLQP